MCTVSLIYANDALHLACNRDESVTRPAALAPRVTLCGGHHAAMPLDPQGGGTWIAASSAGLAFALLNRNPSAVGACRPEGVSRGLVIPALLSCDSLRDAAEKLSRADHRQMRPFRLIAADLEQWWHAEWDGRYLSIDSRPSRCVMYTSSGLGDALVDAPRRRLFHQMVEASPDPSRSQRTFHDHTWPQSPWLGVRMTRDDARTVSQTFITLASDSITVTYRDLKTDTAHRCDLSLFTKQAA